ncbi:MAG: hypothetical protein AAF799_47235 [Myxococcota bacterium]
MPVRRLRGLDGYILVNRSDLLPVTEQEAAARWLRAAAADE